MKLILKAKGNLVQKKVQATRGGKTYETTRWVRASEEQKKEKPKKGEEPKGDKGKSVDKTVKKLLKEYDMVIADFGLDTEIEKYSVKKDKKGGFELSVTIKDTEDDETLETAVIKYDKDHEPVSGRIGNRTDFKSVSDVLYAASGEDPDEDDDDEE